jgi:predicted nucleic acid-binding protein
VRDDEALYERAARFMSRVEAGDASAYLPDLVIAECVFVLTRFYKVPRTEIVDRLKSILSYRGVVVDNMPRLMAALGIVGQHSGISFIDAMCLRLAADRGWNIETFDHKLLKLSVRSPKSS